MASKDLRSYVRSVGGSRTALKYVRIEFGEAYRDVPELASAAPSPNQEGTYEVTLQEVTRNFIKLVIKRIDANVGWGDLSITFSLRSRAGAAPAPPRPPPISISPRNGGAAREVPRDPEAEAHKRLLLQGDKFLNFSSVRGPLEELQADDAASDSDDSPRHQPLSVVTKRLPSTGPWECELRCSADLREFHIKQELQVVVLPAVELMNVLAGRKTPTFARFDGARQEAAVELLSLSLIFQSAVLDLQIPKGTKNGVRRRFELLNSLTWLKCNVEFDKRAHQSALTASSMRTFGPRSVGNRTPSSADPGTPEVYGICDVCKLPVTKNHERVVRDNGIYVHLRCQKSQRSPPAPPTTAHKKSFAEILIGESGDGSTAGGSANSNVSDVSSVTSGNNGKGNNGSSGMSVSVRQNPSESKSTLLRSPPLKSAPEPPGGKSPRKSLIDQHSQQHAPLSLLNNNISNNAKSKSLVEPLPLVSSSNQSINSAHSNGSIGASSLARSSPPTNDGSNGRSRSTSGKNLRDHSPSSRSATLFTPRRDMSPLQLERSGSSPNRRASSPAIPEEDLRRQTSHSLSKEQVQRQQSSPQSLFKIEEETAERKRQQEQNEQTLNHVRNQLSRLQAEVAKQEEEMREKLQKEKEQQEREELERIETMASIQNLKQTLMEDQNAVQKEKEEREIVEGSTQEVGDSPPNPPLSLRAHLAQVERDRKEISRLFARFRETETSDSEEGGNRESDNRSSSDGDQQPQPPVPQVRDSVAKNLQPQHQSTLRDSAASSPCPSDPDSSVSPRLPALRLPPPPPSKTSDSIEKGNASHNNENSTRPSTEANETFTEAFDFNNFAVPPRKSSKASLPMPMRSPPSRPPLPEHGADIFNDHTVHDHEGEVDVFQQLEREEAEKAREREKVNLEKQKLIKQAKELAEKRRLKKEKIDQELRAQREEQAQQKAGKSGTAPVLDGQQKPQQEIVELTKAQQEKEAKELQEWEELIERERTERAIGKEKEAEDRSAHSKVVEEEELSEWEHQLASERLDAIARAEMSKRSIFPHSRSGSQKNLNSGHNSPDSTIRSPLTRAHTEQPQSSFPSPPTRSKSDKNLRKQSAGEGIISKDLELLSKTTFNSSSSNNTKRPGFFRRSLVMGKPNNATLEKVSLNKSPAAVTRGMSISDEPDAIDERLMAELKGVKVGSSGLLSNYIPAVNRRESNAIGSRSIPWTMKSVGQDDDDDALIDEALSSMEETHTELWKRLAHESAMNGPSLAGRLLRVAPDGGETLAYECADGETVVLAFGATVTIERHVAYLSPGAGEVLINFSKVAEAHSVLESGDLISFVTATDWDDKENLDDDTVPVYKFQSATPHSKLQQSSRTSSLSRRSKVSMSMMPSGSNKAAERGLYYVKLLQAGHSIVKYGKSGKPHACTLTVSHDFTKLIWSDNRSSFVFIRDLVSVVPGRMHPNFARYDKENMKKIPAGDSSMLTEQAFKENISITLEFEKRSLSFELAFPSATEKDRDRLVAAIAWIKKQEATTIHNGRVDWNCFAWSVANVFTTFRGPDLEVLTRKDVKFIKHGVLTRHTRFKPIEWWLFLFDDILVVATPPDDTTNKLTIQSVTPLVDLKLDDQVDKAAHLPPDLSFTLLMETTNMSVPFICSDAATRKDWIMALTDAIVGHHCKVFEGKSPSRHEIFLGTIHSAAHLGQKDKLKTLLSQEPGLIDRKDFQGNTALHICAERGHYKLVKTLLRCKALTNMPGSSGMVPLWVCCTLCDPSRPRFPEIVQLLAGAATTDADLMGPDVPTPLHVAISDVFVQGLPEHRGGLNLLQILTLMWRSEALQALMRALPFEQQLLIDFQTQPGTTPLFLAVRRAAKLSNNDGAALQRLELIKKLLQCGAQPNLREDLSLKTALHVSGTNGGVQNILVAFGARPDLMDDLGERALSSSSMKLTAQHRAAFVSSAPPKPDKEVKVDHWEATFSYRKEIQHKIRRRTPHEAKSTTGMEDLKEGLMELLGSHLGYFYLLAQVKSEFSSENLLFWKRLQDYKKDPSSTKALELVRGFVVENAPQQVNISSITRAKIEKAWASYLLSKDLTSLTHVFEVAGTEVMDLMATDSFKRFKVSENFASYKQGKVPAGLCLICLEPATPPVFCRRCAVRCCQQCATKAIARKPHRRVTLANLHSDSPDMDVSGAPLCDGCHNFLSAL